VGGTWYSNRYPGARTDSESWVYAYSFSKELQDDWDWTERFPIQPETLSYLQHVADRFGMREHIDFRTRVASAHYDEPANTWAVTTDAGDTHTCRYFITAAGPLSVPYKPDFPGLDEFTGEWALTGNWPKDGVDVAGKRVVCIGTGAMDDLVNATVLAKGKNSWFLGDNIPGKPHVVLFHFGGAGLYRKECEAAADAGFEGFVFGRSIA
jgi:cyclohexanone monooxygenase